MADFLSGVAAAVDNVLDTVNLGYNIYQDQRNYKFSQQQFDYQKHLNELQMQREDTAVQRRVKDLEAAGLNKNLAAGSAASTGSLATFSGSAGSHSLNKTGSMLDTLNAVYQVQQQKEQTEYLKKYHSKELDKIDAEINNLNSSTQKNQSESQGIDLSNVLKGFEQAQESFRTNWLLNDGGAMFSRMLIAGLANSELTNEGLSFKNWLNRETRNDQVSGIRADVLAKEFINWLNNETRDDQRTMSSFKRQMMDMDRQMLGRSNALDELKYQWLTGNDFNNFMHELALSMQAQELANRNTQSQIDDRRSERTHRRFENANSVFRDIGTVGNLLMQFLRLLF